VSRVRNFVDNQKYGTYANKIKQNTFCSIEFSPKNRALISNQSSLSYGDT